MPQRRNASPERTVQVAVVRWLRLVLPRGSLVMSIPVEQRGASSDPMARARYGAARKASGCMAGTPDLLIAMPYSQCGFFEIKASGGVLSDAQIRVHEQLRDLGHRVGVVDTIEAARGCLLAWGVPLGEAPGQPVAVARVRHAKRRELPEAVAP